MTGGPAPEEREVVAALLALRHRAGGSPSEAAAGAGPAPEAAWRRVRLAALGLLPRFSRR